MCNAKTLDSSDPPALNLINLAHFLPVASRILGVELSSEISPKGVLTCLSDTDAGNAQKTIELCPKRDLNTFDNIAVSLLNINIAQLNSHIPQCTYVSRLIPQASDASSYLEQLGQWRLCRPSDLVPLSFESISFLPQNELITSQRTLSLIHI